jgi:hypothetical protein
MGQVQIQLDADLLATWLTQGARVAYTITAQGLPDGAHLVGVQGDSYDPLGYRSLLLRFEHPDLPVQGPGERPPLWTPEATSLRVAEEAP